MAGTASRARASKVIDAEEEVERERGSLQERVEERARGGGAGVEEDHGGAHGNTATHQCVTFTFDGLPCLLGCQMWLPCWVAGNPFR